MKVMTNFLRLGSLIQTAWRQEFRPMFLIVLLMAFLGMALGIAATYPALTPFIYSLF